MVAQGAIPLLQDRYLSLHDALMIVVLAPIMTSPYVAKVFRPISKRTVLMRRQRSFRLISQRYLRGEHCRFLLFETLIFLILAAVALWPVVNAARFIRTYLL